MFYLGGIILLWMLTLAVLNSLDQSIGRGFELVTALIFVLFLIALAAELIGNKNE